MQIADHLITTQSGHTHHGLYAGEGNVIHLNHYHYTVISNLEKFCQNQNYFIRPYPFRPYSREGSLQRAFELLQSVSPTRFDTERAILLRGVSTARHRPRKVPSIGNMMYYNLYHGLSLKAW